MAELISGGVFVTDGRKIEKESQVSKDVARKNRSVYYGGASVT